MSSIKDVIRNNLISIQNLKQDVQVLRSNNEVEVLRSNNEVEVLKQNISKLLIKLQN